MAHRLSRTRVRATRNVRVGRHRGGMNMATLRPKPVRTKYPCASAGRLCKQYGGGWCSVYKDCLIAKLPSGGLPPKPKGLKG